MARLESAYWSYTDGVFNISSTEDLNELPLIDRDCIRLRMNATELKEFATSLELLLKKRNYISVQDNNVKNKYEEVVQSYHNNGYILATKTYEYTVFIGLYEFTKEHDLLVIDLIQNELYTGFMGASHIGFRVNR